MTDSNMPSGLCQPNTTQIPNEVFDYWMAILTPAEFKVLLCICRKTYGWQKIRDKISLRQLEVLTGLSRRGITQNIESLIEYGLIIKHTSTTEDGDPAPNQYEINVRVHSVDRGGELSEPQVGNSGNQGVGNSGNQQNLLYTKPTITKEESETSSARNGEQVRLSEKDFGLADLLFAKILESDPKAKPPNRRRWAQEIERMHRIDQRSYEEIKALIEFAHSDPFWSSNILSAQKLRKQATQLTTKMKSAKHKKTGDQEENRQIAQNVEKEFAPKARKLGYRIDACRDYIEIASTGGGACLPYHLKYTEHNFVEQLKGEMRKRGML